MYQFLHRVLQDTWFNEGYRPEFTLSKVWSTRIIQRESKFLMFTLGVSEQEWPPLLLFPLSKPQQFAPCQLPITGCFLHLQLAGQSQGVIKICKWPSFPSLSSVFCFCKLQAFSTRLFGNCKQLQITGCFLQLQLAGQSQGFIKICN